MLHDALRDKIPHPETGIPMRSFVEIRDATLTEINFDKKKLDKVIEAFAELEASIRASGTGQISTEKLAELFLAFEELRKEIEGLLKNPYFDIRKYNEARTIANALGMSGLGIAEEFGGDGATACYNIIGGEEVSAIDPALALAFGAANTLAMKPIELFAPQELKEKWLPRMVSGELTGCYCQTTPRAGSDVANTEGRATQDANGNWLVSKPCSFITGGRLANVGLVLVRTPVAPDDPRRNDSHYGLTMFLVDMDRARREGTFIFHRDEHKAGLHMSLTSAIEFVSAVADGILGTLHEGWKVAMYILAASRAKAISPQAIGTGEGVSELAHNYAEQRTQFGLKLNEMPTERERLLKIDAGVNMSRFLAWRAALLLDEIGGLDSRPWQMEASCAKLVSSEMAEWAPSEAMQLMGGTGYIMDAKVAKFWQDGRVIKIYEGTSGVQCIIIMRGLLERLGRKNLGLLGHPAFKYSFATRQATAYQLARDWPVSSSGWPTEEEEFSSEMHRAYDHCPELQIAYHKLREYRYAFLVGLGKTLQDFPPDPKGVTFPSPYFKFAYAFALLEGAKLALWELAFLTNQKNEAPETSDTARAETALGLAKKELRYAEDYREDLALFPALRKKIETEGKLKP